MGTTSIVAAARAALGPVGAYVPISFTAMASMDAQRDAARRLERAGYGAAWTNETIGKDALVQLALLLDATDRLTFGTGIANIWAREPQTAHGAAAMLAQAHPGRLVLGLGVGYPQQAEAVGRRFGSPLSTMRDYLERMAAETWPAPPDAPYARIIGANGPKMLALAGELADGAMPAAYPPEFTARARRALGPDKLLVIGLSVILDPDPDRAREAARTSVAGRLGMPSYAAALTGLGYDVTEATDRLVDAVVAHGPSAAIAARAREHLAAGADHVVLMSSTGGDFEAEVARLAEITTELG